MLESEAHRSLGINARRLLDFLMIEHMHHAGTENGNLLAPYNQLVKFGIPRSEISKAIDALIASGFVEVARGERLGGRPGASRYRLTWLPKAEGTPATNRWRQVTRDDVSNRRQERHDYEAKKKQHKQLRKGVAGNKTKNAPDGAEILEDVREAEPENVQEGELVEQVAGSESRTGGVREVGATSVSVPKEGEVD